MSPRLDEPVLNEFFNNSYDEADLQEGRNAMLDPRIDIGTSVI